MNLTDIVHSSLQDACELYRCGQFPHHLENLSVHDLVKMHNNPALDVQNYDDEAVEVFEDALER